MRKKGSAFTKLIGAALIFFTFASTAVVVAQSCHNEEIPTVAAVAIVHTSHGDHVHAPISNPSQTINSAQGALKSGLLSDICTGIFYLVLFLGGRFLLKRQVETFSKRNTVFNTSYVFISPKVRVNLTLSLPQLGISRI
jgi:hypothetical protein